jgi:hypothetical protein
MVTHKNASVRNREEDNVFVTRRMSNNKQVRYIIICPKIQQPPSYGCKNQSEDVPMVVKSCRLY